MSFRRRFHRRRPASLLHCWHLCLTAEMPFILPRQLHVPSKEAAGDAAPAGGSSDRPRAARNSGGGKLSAAEVEQLQKQSPEFYGLYPQYLQPA